MGTRPLLLAVALCIASMSCRTGDPQISQDGAHARPIAMETAEGARIAEDVDRVVDACPLEGMCPARTAWMKLAANHVTNIVRVLERPGTTPRDDVARSLAAMVILDAQQKETCPDLLAVRILGVAHARAPSHVAGLDVVLARVAIGIDAERLGLFEQLRTLATKYPGSMFQSVFVEELRVTRPTSAKRVELLATLAGGEDPVLQRSAISGLARSPMLPNETCAAVARARASKSPANVLYASLRLAALPCGKERDDALADIEAQTAKAPLPGIPAKNEGLLIYLCAKDLPSDRAKRSIEVLHGIALSSHQPIAIRQEAMDSVRLCIGGDWKTLRTKLALDPDPAVRTAVKHTDGMIIDH